MSKVIDDFEGMGIEINLKNPDDFLKVKETLTRIGITSRGSEKKLYQSCHILHKKGKYRIMHFKELFLLDGRDSSIADSDISRRNKIVSMLVSWGLISVDDTRKIHYESNEPLHVVKYTEKDEWELIYKYKVGKKSKAN